MKLSEDADQFDDWQAYFSYELLRIVKEGLTELPLSAELVREATTTIAFNLSCLIDASAPFAVEGKDITPVLTFTENQETLVYQGGPSSLHEYTHGNASELFGG